MGSTSSQPFDCSHIIDSTKVQRMIANSEICPEGAIDKIFKDQYLIRQQKIKLADSKFAFRGTKWLFGLVDDFGLATFYYEKSIAFKSKEGFLHASFNDKSTPKFNYHKDSNELTKHKAKYIGEVNLKDKSGQSICNQIIKLNERLPAYKNHQKFIDEFLKIDE